VELPSAGPTPTQRGFATRRTDASGPVSDIASLPEKRSLLAPRLKRQRVESVNGRPARGPKGVGALKIGWEVRRKSAMHLAGDFIGQDLAIPPLECV
jgi:hypothetical protein